jgi:hypothetical protein
MTLQLTGELAIWGGNVADWYEMRKAEEKAIAHHEKIQLDKMLEKMNKPNKPRTNHWGGINWEKIADDLSYAIDLLQDDPTNISIWRRVFEIQDRYLKAKEEFSR